ncbi:2-keto-4-pentenoate hydratase/2-oxohepta-3-ene-1,7-dioic acid hydratase in catechol pathway [Variovorax paradoxus]|uniref:2-keto-4-pentenoate hydratase/2-oxohepta-3-ene-1,7-dioic acid hydratase in catechol pathway n=1 Tax=Variovorax paradoxus TaxID=34073 RepID=A0AAW8E873_VARPD|nr:2-keto-4-pentenoate hydratase/2-oxohepta-3-ene-1,7-dioic acid hydratase in catechol pathway [Variovorax paradoxus]
MRIDATVGAVTGRRATRVPEAQALDVSGYRVVSDITLPHENYYRPSIQLRCRDRFCPMSEAWPAQGFDLAVATLRVRVNGEQVHECDFTGLARAISC